MPDRECEAPRRGDPPRAGRVRVLAFAGARDVVGEHELHLELAAPCTAVELWPLLLARFPGLGPFRRSIRLAVNGTYATDDDRVAPGDDVALIPPVAGG